MKDLVLDTPGPMVFIEEDWGIPANGLGDDQGLDYLGVSGDYTGP
jgi:hypothetical protein